MLWLCLAGLAWGGSDLVDAVRADRRAEVQRLLAEGADPNAEAVYESTRRGGLFGLGRLKTTTTRTTAVHEAVDRSLRTGDPRILALVLQAGGDPNAPSRSYPPPLHRVAHDLTRAGVAKTTRALLEGGADPTGTFRQQTPVARLADREEPVDPRVEAAGRPWVTTLLDAGADPTALLCDARQPWLVALLLDKQADPDGACYAFPPLHRAVAASDEGVTRLLLDGGADVHRVGMDGNRPATPLHVAARVGWTDGVSLLVSRGADPNRRAGLLGDTPLGHAGSMELAGVLVREGARRTLGAVSAATEAFGVEGTRLLWSARPLRADEEASFLVSWSEDPALQAPPELPLDGVVRSDLRDALERVGPGRFVTLYPALGRDGLNNALSVSVDPTCAWSAGSRLGALRKELGPVTDKDRNGIVYSYTWATGSVVAWRTPAGRAHLVRVDGLCPAGGGNLAGLPRAAAWLALGPPALPGPSEDRWSSGVVVAHRGEMVTGWGVDFRGP